MKTSTKTKRKEKRMSVGRKYYVLFQMLPKSRFDSESLSAWHSFFLDSEKKEEWGSEDEKLLPHFICICESLAEVAEIVREDTSERYSVVAGTFSRIEPHVQVFMGGVNMNTLKAEGWDGE